MFEAHYDFSREHASPKAFIAYLPTQDGPGLFGDPAPADRLTRRLFSLRHRCPLHAWAAPGKRKDANSQVREQWFLYIEYCRANGTRIWHRLELPRETCCLETLFEQALWLELPHIDAQRTRHWLDQTPI
jgi:hypothetical protein